MIFDDVEVPRDRVFIDARLDTYNAVMMTGWAPNIMQQTMIRAQTKLEFAWGLATRMVNVINAGAPATFEQLGELWSYAEFARACVRAAEAGAREYGNGVWFPDVGPLAALRAALPSWFPRVNEIIRLLGLAQSPGRSDGVAARRSDVATADRSLSAGRERRVAEDRIRVFRLAWDFVGSALASRNEQYERFYLASGARNYRWRI